MEKGDSTSDIKQNDSSAFDCLGGLAVTSFMVMMGYTIDSPSVTHHTQKQIQSETHKLLTKEKKKASVEPTAVDKDPFRLK